MKKKISTALCILSWVALLGVAGNSDLGLEADFGHLLVKCSILLIVALTSGAIARKC